MENIQHTDVLVLGGGSAGIAAAVAAARRGARVTLIERNSFPGGKATAAEVGTICGLYEFTKKEKAAYIVKGFAKEFGERIRQGSGTAPLRGSDGLHYLPYDPGVFKNISLEFLNAQQVDVHFNAVLEKVKIENNRISTVSFISSANPVTISLGSVIDCTGNSIISQAMDLPVIKSDHYQAAAQVFTLEGITETNEARLGMILMKALRSAIGQDLLAEFYDRVYIIPGSLKNNCVSLKIAVPLAVTYAPGNLQELRTVALSFVENLSQFLFRHVAVFSHAKIRHIAPEVGIRVGQRTAGKYLLTEEDVLSCKKFSNAVANAAWPIEEWSNDRRVHMQYLPAGDFYQIPAECLQSNLIDNLFMAGRNISASASAIASARVMGICLQTGFATGILAAAEAMGAPLTEAIKNIQRVQL